MISSVAEHSCTGLLECIVEEVVVGRSCTGLLKDIVEEVVVLDPDLDMFFAVAGELQLQLTVVEACHVQLGRCKGAHQRLRPLAQMIGVLLASWEACLALSCSCQVV